MNMYDQQAEAFLKKANATIDIKLIGVVGRFPGEDRFIGDRGHYEVTVRRGDLKHTFDFYGSVMDWNHRKKPRAYDFLACVQKYEVPEDVWDFAEEYGFEIDSKESYNKVCSIQSACKEEYRKIEELFGDVMEDLGEIA